MTEPESDAWQLELAEAYVSEARSAGRSMPDDAVERELAENRTLLPQGAATPRMLVMVALDETGTRVGQVWAGLDHPRGAPDTAFLYDIEVLEEFRGRGLGRELLAAVEGALVAAGATALDLNVFGNNAAAIRLYSSAGYEVTSMIMRKTLG